MKVTVFADAHGNIEALEKIVFFESDSDLFICLGDAIGYGPYNDECIDLLNSINAIYIKGNHEKMFINGFPDENCSKIAKDFFEISYSYFTKQKKEKIRQLPTEYRIKNYIFTHSLLDRYIYPNTNIDILNMSGNYIIGHSHIQFKLANSDLTIICVGSIGQNRVRKSVAEYAIYYLDKDEIEFK